MNFRDVAEAEELTILEFTHYAYSAAFSTCVVF